MKKENTKSKSDTTLKIEALTRREESRLKQSNKRETIINGAILGLFVVLGVTSALAGAWTAVFNMLGYAMWLGLVWTLERQLNHYRYITNMMSGLHDLERQEIDELMNALSKQESVTVVKKETNNASANA